MARNDCKMAKHKSCPFHFESESTFKMILLSQIGANRYQNIILEILFLSPLWRPVHCSDYSLAKAMKKVLVHKF